ncbi:hypothetical protein GCM10025857_63500 [Alicyclobacillus contaminans]|nr:hypothetical protein GCM10025857_63500 [Alicyclobacillus contaminans]
MNKFWVIAGDVYKKNVRSVSFFIMLLVPFVLGGIIYVAGYFGGQSEEVDTIGITTDSAELAEGINAAAPEDYDFKIVDSRADGEKNYQQNKSMDFCLLN